MMILDTNIVSEMMKSASNRQVRYWLNEQEPSELFITSVTVAEIIYGIRILQDGKRKKHLEVTFSNIVRKAFEFRVLKFDEKAAYQYGDIMAHRRLQGRPLSVCDGQIASIAHVHSYAVVTRNTNDFSGCSLDLINPFEMAFS